MSSRRLAAVAVSAALALTGVACDTEVGEELEDAGEDLGDAASEVGEEIDENVDVEVGEDAEGGE